MVGFAPKSKAHFHTAQKKRTVIYFLQFLHTSCSCNVQITFVHKMYLQCTFPQNCEAKKIIRPWTESKQFPLWTVKSKCSNGKQRCMEMWAWAAPRKCSAVHFHQKSPKKRVQVEPCLIDFVENVFLRQSRFLSVLLHWCPLRIPTGLFESACLTREAKRDAERRRDPRHRTWASSWRGSDASWTWGELQGRELHVTPPP